MSPILYEDGTPCNHPGCLSHVSHPCEGCGRVGGKYQQPIKPLSIPINPDYDFVIGEWGYWINWVGKFRFKREKRLTSFLCQIGWLEIVRELRS